MSENSDDTNVIMKKFFYRFQCSLTAGFIALLGTNVIEVMKVRRINDSFVCNPNHYKTKNLSNQTFYNINTYMMNKFSKSIPFIACFFDEHTLK